MKIVGTLIFMALLVISANGQQLHFPEKDVLFGTFNADQDSARICLATDGPSGAPWCISALGFDFNNGPPSETQYKNHTIGLSYNAHPNGTQIVPGLARFTLGIETKYVSGSGFMSEGHFNWGSPDNSVSVRPIGFTVQHSNGNFAWAQHGDIRFFRNDSNGGGMWGFWHDDGFLDLRSAPQGRIAFKNNFTSLLWANASNSNTIAPLYVDNQNRVVVGGSQVDTLVNSQNLIYTNTIKRGSTQMLGAPCAPITNSNGTPIDDTRAINAALACMRSQGFLPQ